MKRKGKDQPKRLAPTSETLRELFLKSGNLCAFPNCMNLMMNADGKFIGQICHIQAAEPGGERFNKNMSNEERRQAENLMLMCYEHHVLTNDVGKYDCKRLTEMKRDHESKFTDASSAMLETIKDWTQVGVVYKAGSLKNLQDVLDWNLDEEEAIESAEELNDYVQDFRNAPAEARQLLGQFALRFNTIRAKRNRSALNMELAGEDTRMALALSHSKLKTLVDVLAHHGLAWTDSDGEGGWIICVAGAGGVLGWKLMWADIAKYCEKTDTDISKFTMEFHFDLLG